MDTASQTVKKCCRRILALLSSAGSVKPNMVASLLGLCAVLSLIFLVNGCTTEQRQYHSIIDKTKEPALIDQSTNSNYVLSVIEFDECGEYWETNELIEAQKTLDTIKSNGVPVTLIVFVHGWNNDASTNSGNYVDFSHFVTNFAYALNLGKTNKDEMRVVFGVYAAWRGNPYRAYASDRSFFRLKRLLEYLTIYGRKEAAGRVAGPDFSSAILSLASKTRMSQGTNVDTKSKVLIIGHSLGGLIVERGLIQPMLGTIYHSIPEYKERIARSNDLALQAIKEYSLSVTYSNLATNFDWAVKGPYSNIKNYIKDQTAELNDEIRKNTMELGANELAYTSSRDSILSASAVAEFTIRNARKGWNEFIETGRFSSSTREKLENNLGLERSILADSLINRDYNNALTDKSSPLLGRVNLLKYLIQEFEGVTNKYQNLIKLELAAKPLDQKNTQNIFNQLRCEIDGLKTNNLFELTNYVAQLKLFADQTNALWEKYVSARDRGAILLKSNENLISFCITNHAAAASSWNSSNNIAVYYFNLAERDDRNAKLHTLSASRPPADLVLLINPADEAIIAKEMIEALNNPFLGEAALASLRGGQYRPWIISISSEGDTATSKSFPFAQGLIHGERQFRKYTNVATRYVVENGYKNPKTAKGPSPVIDENYQAYYYDHTAPHTPVLVSHVIKNRTTIPLLSGGHNPMQTIFRMNFSEPQYKSSTTNLFTIINGTNYVYDLQQVTNSFNKTGYWVIAAGKELLPDHTTIFTTNFYGVVSGLYRISTLLAKSPAPEQDQNVGTNGIDAKNVGNIISQPPK